MNRKKEGCKWMQLTHLTGFVVPHMSLLNMYHAELVPHRYYFKRKKWNRKTNLLGDSIPTQNLNRACKESMGH